MVLCVQVIRFQGQILLSKNSLLRMTTANKDQVVPVILPSRPYLVGTLRLTDWLFAKS